MNGADACGLVCAALIIVDLAVLDRAIFRRWLETLQSFCNADLLSSPRSLHRDKLEVLGEVVVLVLAAAINPLHWISIWNYTYCLLCLRRRPVTCLSALSAVFGGYSIYLWLMSSALSPTQWYVHTWNLLVWPCLAMM